MPHTRRSRPFWLFVGNRVRHIGKRELDELQRCGRVRQLNANTFLLCDRLKELVISDPHEGTQRFLVVGRKSSDPHVQTRRFWKYFPLRHADGSSVMHSNKPQRTQLADGRRKHLARVAVERSDRAPRPLCVGGCGEIPPPGFAICDPCFEAERACKVKQSKAAAGARGTRNLK